MAAIDDLDLLETYPYETGPATMEELEEYEPRYKLKPIDLSGLSGLDEKPTGPYYKVVDEPDAFLDMFESEDEPEPEVKAVRVKPKTPLRDCITSEQKVFLSHYMGSGTVSTALKVSKTPIARYRKWLEFSPKFAQAMADSADALVDRLESEALKQALSGNTKVLLKALEALRPQKWGRNSTVTSFIDAKMKVEIKDWAQLSRQAEVVDIAALPEGDE